MSVKSTTQLPIKDQSGRLLDLGMVKHTAEYKPFPDPSLPSWLVADNNVVSEPTGPNAKPGLRITATTPSPGARLRMSAAMPRGGLAASRIELVGMTQEVGTHTAPGTVGLCLTPSAAYSAAEGVLWAVYQKPGQQSEILAGTHREALNYSPTAGADQNRGLFVGLSLSLLVDWREHQAWALEGDEVVGWADLKGRMTLPASVNPSIHFRPGQPSDVFHVQGVRVTHWFD